LIQTRDWEGGRAALAKAKEAAPRPNDQLDADEMLAWSWFSEGNTVEAIKLLDAMERDAERQHLDWWTAYPSILRAFLLVETGNPLDALKQVGLAREKADKVGLSGDAANAIRRFGQLLRLTAEARLGRITEAEATLALIYGDSRAAPANAQLESSLHYGYGAVALAKGDVKGAADQFARCLDDDFYCRYQLALAEEKLGDALGASGVRYKLITANRRDLVYLYVWSRLTAPKPTVTTIAK
jgi:hypothetical protein